MSKFVLTAQLQLQAPNNVAQVVNQIQSQLNGVTVNLQVQGATKAQQQIQQVTQNVQQATTAAERMGKAFAVSVRRFAAFSIATRAVGLFTSTLGDATRTAINFERQLIKVSQVTGKSVGQLRDLTNEITRLSTGLGVSSDSLLEVTTVLAQAGLSANDTKVALNALAKAALAPNFDSISETAEGAIAILAQFQQGVGALESQLGSINSVAGAFAVEASDLIDVVRRTGGVFKSSGGSLNELLALFTSVRATTRESAESIGTGLRTIFTRIQRPKTIEFLKQFGVELVDLEGKFVGPYEAVRRLSEGLSGLGERDITFIKIAEELGGFRQIGKVLPLLQQFATAEAALNVATKSNNSLTSDAASAQAALAIRIMKVKEEFLSLVRSITETSTFQVFANTSLALASALIKLADSIKPLLPLLGAMAAIRLTKGIGGFLGGVGGGLSSARTFNKGGKVHHFARGGMVPGVGNGDTVPAMLSPGEFVIRKSSVKKLGASNLAAMNSNRYAEGGFVTTAEKLARARGPQKTQLQQQNQKKAKYSSGRDGEELRFSVNDGNIGAFFMNKEGTPDGLKPFRSKNFDITNSKLLSLAGVKPYKNKGDRMAGKPDTFSAKGILEAGNVQTFYPSIGDIKSGSLSQIIQNNVKTKLSEAVISVANDVSSKKLLDIPPIDSNDALLSAAAKRIQSDSGAIRTTSGYLYEGVIDALTGARPASGNAVFDFPASSLQGNRKRLSALFGNSAAISKLKQADAKASYSSKIIDGDMGSGSISSKIVNSINNGVLAGINIKKKFFGGLIQKFAIGGGVRDPKAILEKQFERSSTLNAGLLKKGMLSRGGAGRQEQAQRMKDARKLETTVPEKLYNSFSRKAFDSMASQTGLNKNPEIPPGTNYFQQEKYFGQEVAKIAGKSFRLQGYLSTSKDFSKAKMFLDNAPRSKDSWAAMMSILTKRGSRGVDVVEQLKGRKVGGARIDKATGKTLYQKPPESESEFLLRPNSRFKINSAKFIKLGSNKNVWMDVQQFANGGIASAPLIDDILSNASGSLLPRPSSAIASLIKAGGGAIDIDRTLKRTIGDKAYSSAKTGAAKSAVLSKYFKDDAARLNDIKTAPITSFGKELQAAIKSRQLNPNKLSIISKSSRTRGVAEYLSQLFGIPISNMMFTSGGSKQPAMDALRVKGPRSNRVGFATGGGVGTDTIPALLTPGEFVVNRASARSIGYGNLNRMNKVGRYANGGIVQGFENGTTMVGAQPAKSKSNPNTVAFVSLQALSQQADTLSKTTQQVNQAQQEQRRSIKETISANKMFAASMAVGLLQGFLPPLDENANALTRMSHGLLGVVSTLTTVGFALEAFNIQLQTRAIFDFFTGAKSLTGTFKSLKSLQPVKALKAGFNRGVSGSSIQASTSTGKIGQFAGSAFTKGKDFASAAGSRLSAAGSSINSSQIGKGFSAGFNRPDVNTFSKIFGSSKGMGTKASGVLGRTLSIGGNALSKIPGAGLIGRGLSSAGGAVAQSGSQFVKGTGALLKNPSKAIIGSGASKSAQAGAFLGKGLSNLNKLGGTALGLGIAFTAVTSIVDAFTDYQAQANKAIQEGNVDKAKSNAVEAAGADAVNSLGSAIIGASAAFGPIGLAVGVASAGLLKLGSELPLIGPSIKKFAIGIGTFFGGNNLNSIETLAAAQAQAVKTQKAFEQGQKDAASALEDLQNGTISAGEALSKIANVQVARQASQTANEKAAQANLENKSTVGRGSIRRNIGALGGFNPFMETAGAKNTRLDKESAALIKQNAESERKAFDISRPIVNESMKRGLAQGMTKDQINAQLGTNSAQSIRSRASELRIKGANADIAGDKETGNAFREQAQVLADQAKELDKAFENLAKEAERNRKAFEAMNLGMQNVQGAASSAALGLSNYIASQQAGNIPLQQSLATLEASVTSAAQGISEADFDAALGDAEATLRKFGANDQQVNKFKQNLKSVNEVQKNSATIFAQTKAELQGKLSSGSADDRKNAFSDILGRNLASQKDASGNRAYDDDTIKRLQDQVGTLTEDQINALGQGDFSVFESAMGDLGKKVLDQVNGPLNDAIKIQEQLNQLTKNRIEAERNLMSAQQEALNVQMEARDIEAKYGGKAVTPGERRANIVAQANVQATGTSGVNALKTGSAAEIATRTGEIGARQKEIADIRAKAAGGDKDSQAKLAGEAGLKLEEEEKRLNEAAKNQIQTTRDLIKVKEEELKTIQEKNKLEKQSMESLINGDIEKFFDQQAAVGATAAIATGNQDLMNSFGATALAGAYSDIERQKEAGVQEIYGQRIAGPGGLGEKAATAALSARGVQNPAAAQMLAGTTPEEEAVNSEIRALAATMGPTADLQVQSAQYQLDAANKQIEAANIQVQKAIDQTRDRGMAEGVRQTAEADRAAKDEEAKTRGREAVAYNRGGTVYASRGIFVPRGTDTVPAMLTPGEFVVRREAVNRGNNLQLLQSINNGMSGSAGAATGVQNFARGGKVQYLAGGGLLNGIVQNILGTDVISMLTKALTTFTSQMSDTIKSLQDTKFKISLDSTNVNVNITGNSGTLAALTQEARNEIAKIVSDKIKNTSVGSGGKLVENTGTLPKS